MRDQEHHGAGRALAHYAGLPVSYLPGAHLVGQGNKTLKERPRFFDPGRICCHELIVAVGPIDDPSRLIQNLNRYFVEGDDCVR